MLLLPVASLWFQRGSFGVLTSCSGNVRPSWKNNRQSFRQRWRAAQKGPCPEDYTAPPFPLSYCTIHPQWKGARQHFSTFAMEYHRVKSKIIFIFFKRCCVNIGMTVLSEWRLQWKRRKEGTIMPCCSHAIESINSSNRNWLLELRRPSAVAGRSWTTHWARREEFEVWRSWAYTLTYRRHTRTHLRELNLYGQVLMSEGFLLGF